MSDATKLQFELAQGATLEEIKENVRMSPICQQGDVVLVWAQESALAAAEHRTAQMKRLETALSDIANAASAMDGGSIAWCRRRASQALKGDEA